MAAADELYLLFQQCTDLKKEKILEWEKHFDWLEEVVQLSNEARGQSVLPKTPMASRKAKRKKVDPEEAKENAFANNDFIAPSTGLRKSSRAAAKTASQKIEMNLHDISNIGCKLRRPSSPKKVTFTQKEALQELKSQQVQIEKDIKLNRCASIVEVTVLELEENDNKCTEILEERKSNAKSCRSDSGIGSDRNEIDFESDIKRKSKEILNTVEEESNSLLLERMHSEPKANEPLHSESDPSELIQNGITVNKFEHDKILMPPPYLSCHLEDELKVEFETEKIIVSDTQLEEENKRPVRSTRTKKRQTEEKDVEVVARVTRTKKRKIEEEIHNATSNVLRLDNKIENYEKPSSPVVVENIQATETLKRMTRSKVRQISKVSSPAPSTHQGEKAHKQNINNLSSPRNNRMVSPSTSSTMNTRSPLRGNFPYTSSRKHTENDTISEVEEVSVLYNEVTDSPVKVVKHNVVLEKPSSGKTSKYQTPTKSSMFKARIQGLYNSSTGHLHSNTSVLSSGSLHSVLSQKRPLLSSSSPNISSSRIIGTPTEVNRTKNLLSGMTSFITKVQPPKPTKEESDERKLEELRKKNEREEERRRKKEEILKLKAEEQKRKNDERMRRVQETRESREKKALEARQMQENERKLKEDRLREERKKQAIAKKKEEIARLQRLKEQDDKQRQIEEQKRFDERHKEEQKRMEEKLKEEERKAELKLREEIRKSEEKLRNEQRKAELKQKEEQRKAEEKQREELRVAEEKKRLEQKKTEEKVKEERRKVEEKLKEEHRRADEILKLEQKKKEEHKREEEKQREEHRRVEEKQREEHKRVEEKEKEQRRAEEKRQKLEEQKLLLEQKREKEQHAREEYERQKAKEKERIEREKMELVLLKEKEEAAKKEDLNSTYAVEPKEHQSNTTFTKPSESANADSYEITPVAKKPIKKKSTNPDDYNINDIGSDDSTDEEGAPKKQIPLWAKGDLLRKNLFSQEYYPPTIDEIFPPTELLTMPDLSCIFTAKSQQQKIKYNKRTSSAVWDTPPYKPSSRC